MAKDILFTRETFLAAMRREKKRKQEWEEKMNKKLDDLQEKIKLANDSWLGFSTFGLSYRCSLA